VSKSGCIILWWGLKCRPICTSCARRVMKSVNTSEHWPISLYRGWTLTLLNDQQSGMVVYRQKVAPATRRPGGRLACPPDITHPATRRPGKRRPSRPDPPTPPCGDQQGGGPPRLTPPTSPPGGRRGGGPPFQNFPISPPSGRGRGGLPPRTPPPRDSQNSPIRHPQAGGKAPSRCAVCRKAGVGTEQ